MQFHEFGSVEHPPLLLMHGMLQSWQTLYEMLKPLEERFRLIVPAMDGMYQGSSDFTCFADQCQQIEEYVIWNYAGQLHGIYGISQGATVLSELLARNRIRIKTAVLDGIYVAHQGKVAAWFGILMFRMVRKNGGHFPKSMNVVMKLMGLKREDLTMFEKMYWDASDTTLRRNLIENYTYRANSGLKNTDARVILWCGNKEPYALKSQRIIKPYLKNCEEAVFEGLGHGQLLYTQQDRICNLLKKEFEY